MAGLTKWVTMSNREQWLTDAIEELWPLVEEAGGKRVPTRVSIGWPFGNPRKRIGECFPSKSAKDGAAHLFVSPLLDSGVHALATLAHELIHAADDCKSGHKAAFKVMATKLGLEGKMTATVPGDELQAKLKEIAAKLGTYPHQGLAPTERKVQTTRMMKLVCRSSACECHMYSEEGYTVRTTRKWIEIGMPACPFGGTMSPEED